MTDDVQRAKEDIAYLRSIAEGSSRYMLHNGAILTAIGVVFGFGVLRLWALESGYLGWPASLRPFIPWDMIAVGVLVIVLVNWRLGRQYSSPTGRAFTAAWSAVGWGVTVAVIALAVAAIRMNQPVLVTGVFPVVLLTLYGSAWWVVFSLLRRRWYAGLSIASYLTAVACGMWMGTAAQWLVLGLGILVCAGLPGVALVRQSRNQRP